MRISDWSSDVCSSDLEVPLRQAWRNEHKFTDCCFLQGCSHQRCDEQSGNVGSLICSTRNHLGAPVAVGCPVSRRLVHAISLGDRKSTRLNSSHSCASRMPSSACKKKNNTRRNSMHYFYSLTPYSSLTNTAHLPICPNSHIKI